MTLSNSLPLASQSSRFVSGDRVLTPFGLGTFEGFPSDSDGSRCLCRIAGKTLTLSVDQLAAVGRPAELPHDCDDALEFDGAITRHATDRMRRRSITEHDLAAASVFGRVVRRAGVEFFFMGDRDLPPDFSGDSRRLRGLTVVAASGLVVTAYRNPDAISKLKKKPRWLVQNGDRRQRTAIALQPAA